MTAVGPGRFDAVQERGEQQSPAVGATTGSLTTETEARIRSRIQPRRGDVVRVRSRADIITTLDRDASIESLPFMPEMLAFCGQELTVWARADKSCDTVNSTGNRRMDKTVHLVGARCTGSAHGGCEAQCMLFWREEWLEWPDKPGKPISAAMREGGSGVSEESLLAATRATPGNGGTYRCQATEHFRASSPIPRRHYVQYLHDIRIRNITIWNAIRGLLVIAFNKYQWLTKRVFPSWMLIRGGRHFPFLVPTGTGERLPAVEFQPGDLVEIRSKQEILATLGPDQRNGNMHFDEEMLPYCGRRARVVGKVTRILDETSGKMIKLSDCYVLEDVICLGLYKRFCQRAITPYWRSAWLRKVDDSGGPSAPLPSARVGPVRRS